MNLISQSICEIQFLDTLRSEGVFPPKKNAKDFHQKSPQILTVTTMKTKLSNLGGWWIVLISNQEIIALWLA